MSSHRSALLLMPCCVISFASAAYGSFYLTAILDSFVSTHCCPASSTWLLYAPTRLAMASMHVCLHGCQTGLWSSKWCMAGQAVHDCALLTYKSNIYSFVNTRWRLGCCHHGHHVPKTAHLFRHIQSQAMSYVSLHTNLACDTIVII